jgi:hypothetical protein
MKENMPSTYGVYVDRGPAKVARRTGRAAAGLVLIDRGGELTMERAYGEARVQEIVEQGRERPREIPPELRQKVEAARATDKEDHKHLEMTFAGIGTSGSYGSLDGRNRRRPAKRGSEQA